MAYFPSRRRVTPAADTTARALAALNVPFVVADLETTGLSPASCEILEFAAVRVHPEGGIEGEYSQVVRIEGRVPSFIARLTGISQDEVERDDRPIAETLDAFLDFARGAPMFFHNASFDSRFLRATAQRHARVFDPDIHCTLQLARRAWPELASHKLGVLAAHLGASTPTHRALADVHTTVAVALAARARLTGKGR